LRLRHAFVVFAAFPVVLFSILPLAQMSPAFEQPAVTATWSPQA
jgi:hypothetical protein